MDLGNLGVLLAAGAVSGFIFASLFLVAIGVGAGLCKVYAQQYIQLSVDAWKNQMMIVEDAQHSLQDLPTYLDLLEKCKYTMRAMSSSNPIDPTDKRAIDQLTQDIDALVADKAMDDEYYD